MATVPAAPLSSWALTRASSAAAVISGTSPLMITTVASSSMCSVAAATASPVPFGCSWMARCTPSGSRSSSRRLGLSTTTTFPAPASRAAVTGQRISGRPQSGCRTLGSAERMRVPSPAAMMTTVGADTARIVVSDLRAAVRSGRSSDLLGSGVKAALGTLNPSVLVRIQAPQPADRSSRSVRRWCEHVFVPRYGEQELRDVVAKATSLSEGSASLRATTRRRQPPPFAPLARGLGHLDRPLHARLGDASTRAYSARGDPR